MVILLTGFDNPKTDSEILKFSLKRKNRKHSMALKKTFEDVQKALSC